MVSVALFHLVGQHRHLGQQRAQIIRLVESAVSPVSVESTRREIADDEQVAIGYTSFYPSAMILKILAAQILAAA